MTFILQQVCAKILTLARNRFVCKVVLTGSIINSFMYFSQDVEMSSQYIKMHQCSLYFIIFLEAILCGTLHFLPPVWAGDCLDSPHSSCPGITLHHHPGDFLVPLLGWIQENLSVMRSAYCALIRMRCDQQIW